jgi:hypothetical protein
MASGVVLTPLPEIYTLYGEGAAMSYSLPLELPVCPPLRYYRSLSYRYGYSRPRYSLTYL